MFEPLKRVCMYVCLKPASVYVCLKPSIVYVCLNPSSVYVCMYVWSVSNWALEAELWRNWNGSFQRSGSIFFSRSRPSHFWTPKLSAGILNWAPQAQVCMYVCMYVWESQACMYVSVTKHVCMSQTTKRVCMSETQNYYLEEWFRILTENVQYLTFN